MSKITTDHIFTSESVSEGHPDKICDRISDAVLDACLARDAKARVACETLTTTNFVINAGEIRCREWEKINPEALARKVVKEIGYDKEEYLFCSEQFEYENRLHEQSPEIAQGVDKRAGEEIGAGDQGMMFGYATDETPSFLPYPIALSHELLQYFARKRKSKELEYLRPDAKSQVSIEYKNGKPVKLRSIVLSHQTNDLDIEMVRREITGEIKKIIEKTPLETKDTTFYINPTGKFVIGGPHGDAGLTGRKIIVDTYGGVGSHGGGAFSGKDPSKVDRSAAYYARYVAKNLVAAGVASKCEIQVSYAIGISHPISINIDTYKTNKIAEEKIEAFLNSQAVFDFRPSAILATLQLTRPVGWSYQDTSCYGHFGKPKLPWEKLDKVELIKQKLH